MLPDAILRNLFLLRTLLKYSILFSSLSAHCHNTIVLVRRTKYPILFFCQVFQHVYVFLKDSSFLNEMFQKDLLDAHEWRHFVKHFLLLKCQRCRTYLLTLLIIFLPYHIISFIFLILHLYHILCIVLLWILKLIILNYNYFVPLVEIGRQTIVLIENRENETNWLLKNLMLLIVSF